jgi:hypothetical protein
MDNGDPPGRMTTNKYDVHAITINTTWLAFDSDRPPPTISTVARVAAMTPNGPPTVRRTRRVRPTGGGSIVATCPHRVQSMCAASVVALNHG